jgi:hypothetical protein
MPVTINSINYSSGTLSLSSLNSETTVYQYGPAPSDAIVEGYISLQNIQTGDIVVITVYISVDGTNYVVYLQNTIAAPVSMPVVRIHTVQLFPNMLMKVTINQIWGRPGRIRTTSPRRCCRRERDSVPDTDRRRRGRRHTDHSHAVHALRLGGRQRGVRIRVEDHLRPVADLDTSLRPLRAGWRRAGARPAAGRPELITANQLIELALATCMPLPITIRGITGPLPLPIRDDPAVSAE